MQKFLKRFFKNQRSDKPTLTFALCGNPNCGKTTLFNLLTGSNQKVGNWPGVTVERKTGFLRAHSTVAVTDTPGIYSLSPFTPDEQVAQGYLLSGKPDLIINVVDSTNLERSLFLTSQLAELDTPLVVALNMQDEALQKGIVVDEKVLEKTFGCKFFVISAAKNQGVENLIEYCIAANFTKQKRFEFCAQTEQLLQTEQKNLGNVPNARWLAIQNVCKKGEVASQIAQERYEKISQTAKQAQKSAEIGKKQLLAQRITQKIDAFVLNKWLAFPIFATVMALVFYLSIGGVGGFLTNLINDKLTPWLQASASTALDQVPLLRSLVVDGVITGVMSVASFLPQIMLLFGFIALLEACGYMSRIAFITDRLLNKIGLGGRSFVSMILGCGCSVPAIMSTRTIKNVKERNATITLTPFMPCSAKLAVISFFTSKLLGGNPLFAISFYFLSILAIILGGLVLKTLNRRQEDDWFILELPEYRAPKLANVCKQMWERGKAFLIKAGTTIFAASIILWLLQNFNFKLEAVEKENSILAAVGKLIAPIFAPLGFDDRGCGWQFAVSTLTGIAAKETVFETLQILLPQGVENCISPLGAYAFVVYNVLTVPCVAAISASFAEQGAKGGVFSAVFQIATAYVVSLALYQLGKFAQNNSAAFATTLCTAALATAFGFALKYTFTHRSCAGDCKNCPLKNCKKQR